MLMQDRLLKDSHKLIGGNKEFRGKLVSSLMQRIDDLPNTQEIKLFSSLFTKEYFDESKFIGFAMS